MIVICNEHFPNICLRMISFDIPKWVDFSDDWDVKPSCISFFLFENDVCNDLLFDMAKVNQEVSVD